MEAMMTDYQYQTILKSIKMILQGCRDIAEAEERIDELLGEKPKRQKAKKKTPKKASEKKKD